MGFISEFVPGYHSVLRPCLKLLTQGLRSRCLRKLIHIRPVQEPGFKFKLAETKDEWTAVFRLAKLVDEELPAHFAVPCVSVLIVIWNGTVVGFAGLVRDSAFGLPSESLIELNQLKKRDQNLDLEVAELASFVIHPDFSGKSVEIGLPLLKFAYHYSRRCFRVSGLLIRFKDESLLELCAAVFPLEEIGANVTFVDFRSIETEMIRACVDSASVQKVFNYLFREDIKAFKLPNREFYRVTDPVRNAGAIAVIFSNLGTQIEALSNRKKEILADFYPADQPLFTLPTASARSFRDRSHRYFVRCTGGWFPEQKSKSVPIEVHDVSYQGIGIKTKRRITLGSPLLLKIQVGQYELVAIEAVPVWATADGAYGLRVTQASPTWGRFIEYLQEFA